MAIVYVVDDYPGLASAVAGALRSAGYETKAFRGGLRVLEALQEKVKPDVIVTDLNMPGMTGIQLAAQVRERCSNVWLILMSSERLSAEELLEHGFAGQCTKGQLSDDLENLIASLLSG